MTDQRSGAPTSTPRGQGWRDRLDSLLPARLRQRHSRGAAELSVLVVTGSLVAGVFFGQGISGTAVQVADGLTWLTDEPSGQVIQVNPATGQLEVKQKIGNPGDDLEVTGEDGGQLYVADHTSGRLTAFDLTSVLVSGQRRISTGGAVDTIYNDDGVFLVDPDQSTIAAMDPQTTDAIGTVWVARSGLADAVVDGEGTIWALEDDGTLHRLRWSTDTLSFDDEDEQSVEGSRAGSVLVAHPRGVTVFGPDQGMVAQVGTDHDLWADAAKVIGDVYAPERTPSDLVPVASADNGHVVIVRPDSIREVDMGAIACDEPGTPEVFRGEVWVPCTGQGRVVRLDEDGRRVGADISTPGSDDPELVLDDDNLVINAPGAPQGIVVHSDGSQTTIVRENPQLPTNGMTPSTTVPPATDQSLLDDLLDLGGDDEDPAPDPAPPTPGPSDPPTGSAGGDGGGSTGGGTGVTPPRCQQGQQGTPSGTGTPTGPPDTRGVAAKPRSCTGIGTGNGGGTGGGTGGSGGSGGSAGQPVTSPTDVTAQAMAEGQVRVTWRHSGIPRADGFVITSSTGSTPLTVKGWVREAFADVTPGEPTTFTVTAVLGDYQAASAPSNAVTSTARPGAPEVTAAAAYAGDDEQEVFVVGVRWSGASANGEPITSYDVTVQTPTGSQSEQVPASQDETELRWTCSRRLDADCKVGGDYTVTVVARNALGGSDAGTFVGKAPAQPPAPLPDSGRQIVDATSPRTDDAADDGTGSIALRLRPAGDWARFPGTCSYVLDAQAPQPVACNQTAVAVGYDNGPLYQPDDGRREHTLVFHAENGRGKATSATFTFTTHQTPLAPQPEPPAEPEPPTDPAPTPCPVGEPCPAIP